jgi:hypothetical protein
MVLHSSDIFRFAQSDIVLKHSDVLLLRRKVMLSLPLNFCEANITSQKLHYEVTSLAEWQT